MAHAILVVDRDAALTGEVCAHFRHQRWEAEACASAEDALRQIGSTPPDIVLAEDDLPDMHAVELAGRMRRLDGGAKLIVMSADHRARNAVSALKAGASDYVTKPLSLPDLQRSIETLLGGQSAAPGRRRAWTPPAAGEGIDAIVGASPVMQELKATLRQMAAAAQQMLDDDFPAVLIHGETGTGKELVARALHGGGRRRTGRLVEINCASLPPQLLEAELFGYQPGAFTHATTAKAGLVEEADGGTLFLDEIGEIDFSIQAKLLKLIEEKSSRRLGATTLRHLDVRIVSATNRNLEQMVRAGKFRGDLFFRLRVVALQVPPLRARGRDVLLLARHFLAQQGQRYGRPTLAFAADAEQALVQYEWPGNVRELRNVIEQAVVLAADPIVTARQLRMSSGRVADADVLDRPRGGVKPGDENLRLMLDALVQSQWNVAKAARLLGLSSDKMRYRIDQLGLSPAGTANRG